MFPTYMPYCVQSHLNTSSKQNLKSKAYCCSLHAAKNIFTHFCLWTNFSNKYKRQKTLWNFSRNMQPPSKISRKKLSMKAREKKVMYQNVHLCFPATPRTRCTDGKRPYQQQRVRKSDLLTSLALFINMNTC